MVESLIERAKNRASSLTQSGMENALRNEVRALAQTWRPSGSRSTDAAARAARKWDPEMRDFKLGQVAESHLN
jgi:hypothetical protein